MVTRIPTVAPRETVLRDGSMVVIRPLTAGDVTTITTWFEGLGPETRYARFLASVQRLDDRTVRELAHVDHLAHEALVAVTVGGTAVGLADYVRLPQPGVAELSVAVADRWCGRGIATLLLQRIAARARAAGIRWLSAQCLVTNTAILRQLSRLGPMSVASAVAGVVEARIDLSPDGPGRMRPS